MATVRRLSIRITTTTMHNYTDNVTAGMAEAEARYRNAMLPAQIEQQYSEIQARPTGYVQPGTYAPQPSAPQQSLSPILVKAAGGVVVGALAVKAVVVVITAGFAWMEANAFLCGAIVAVVVALLSIGRGGGSDDGGCASAGRGKVIVRTTVTTEAIVN